MLSWSWFKSNGQRGAGKLRFLVQVTMASGLLAELALYLRLAHVFKSRLQLPDRDRCLVLAGSCASLLKLKPVANFCRTQILQNNPGHMLRRWNDFDLALQDDDFHVFLKQLGRRFPVEKGESILRDHGYHSRAQAEDFASELDFASAVLGVETEWLEDNFS